MFALTGLVIFAGLYFPVSDTMPRNPKKWTFRPRRPLQEPYMSEGFWLLAALGCCAVGMGWLALAKKAHWQQIRGSQPLGLGTRRILYGLAAGALAGSLLLCLRADHPSMAALVWVMALAASAQLIAFTLAWRPLWLAWLAFWVRREPQGSDAAR